MLFDYTTLVSPNGQIAWKRSGEHLRSLLKTMPDGRVVALKPIAIMFPETYLEKSLCKYRDNIECLGVFALLDPESNTYAVFNIPAMVYLPMTDIKTVMINDVAYKVLEFSKHQTILNSDAVISNTKISYWIYDYFIALARVPWFMSYLDVLRLYRQDSRYLGALLSNSTQIIDMVYSSIARSPKDDRQMYRTPLSSMEDLNKIQPQWVPLKSVSLGAVDTMSKIMGAYYDEGVNSALAEPSKKLTDMEKILRA